MKKHTLLLLCASLLSGCGTYYEYGSDGRERFVHTGDADYLAMTFKNGAVLVQHHPVNSAVPASVLKYAGAAAAASAAKDVATDALDTADKAINK